MSSETDSRIVRWIRRSLSMCAVSYFAACQTGAPEPPSNAAQTTQAVQIADTVSSSQPAFFPVGFFIDGHQVDVPEPTGTLTNNGYFNSGIPVDANDASRFYGETLTQIRSLGMNAFLMPNMDVIGTEPTASTFNAHLKALTTKAAEFGSIYGVPSSSPIQGLLTPVGEFSASEDTCQHQSLASIDTAVRQTFAAAVESCVDQNGIDQKVFCNSDQCTRFGNACCPASQSCVRKPGSQSLLGFYTHDEPSEGCLPTLRGVSQRVSFYAPLLSGFASVSNVVDCQKNPTYRGALMDKMLGHDNILYDDIWPLSVAKAANPDCPGSVAEPETPLGDVNALERWGARLDNHYVLAPADKPLYYDIQTGSDCCIRQPSIQETRYLTYAALARGVKGLFFYLYGPQPVPENGGGPADTDYNLNQMAPELRRLAANVRKLAPWLAQASRDLPQKNGRAVIASATRTTPGASEGAAYDYDISSFTTKNGEHLIMLVNEQMGNGDLATLDYQVTVDSATAAQLGLFDLGAVTVHDVNIECALPPLPPSCPTSTGPGVSFTATLAQGEGRLYRLQRELSAEVSIARDAYHNPIAAPKPLKVQLQIRNAGTVDWSTSGANSVRLGVRVYAPQSAPTEILGLSLGGGVARGTTTTTTVSLPTGAGTNITQSGTYELGFYLYKEADPSKHLNTEQRISVMIVPPGSQPLLVDTFDSLPFGSSADGLRKWNRTELMKVRDDRLAINGGGQAVSHWGGAWTNYTAEFDLMIDVESGWAARRAGWTMRSATPGMGYAFILNAEDSNYDQNKITVNQLVPNAAPIYLGSLDIGSAIKRDTWYHIKQAVVNSGSTVTITTQLSVSGSTVAAMTLAPVIATNGYGTGGIGFLLREPEFQGSACSGSPISKCVGGTTNGAPCYSGANCLGGTCSQEDESCYPSLERGHFDNVFVYEPVTAAAPTGVGNVTGSAAGYPWTLSWTRPETIYTGDALISHYRVYRSSTCSFTPSAATLVAEPVAPSYIERAAGTFCYKVTAVSFADVESVASPGTTGQILAPLTVPTVAATVNYMKSVTVTWGTVAAAVKYNIYRGEPGFVPSMSTLLATVSASATSYQDAPQNMYVADTQLGLNGFASYRYAVVPVAIDGVVDSAVAGYSADVTPPGSSVFSDGFDGTNAKWQQLAGTWSVSSSVYEQTNTAGFAASTIKGSAPVLSPQWGDVSVETTVQIEGATKDDRAVGITLRKTNATDHLGATASGYFVYLQADGTVGIRGSLAAAPIIVAQTGLSALAPARSRLRVDVSGRRWRVFVDGVKYIDKVIEGSTTKGFVDLGTYHAQAKFYDVNVLYREGFADMALNDHYDNFYCAPSKDAEVLKTFCSLVNWDGSAPWKWVWERASNETSMEQPEAANLNEANKLTAHNQRDGVVSVVVKVIDDGGDLNHWVGVALRKQAVTHRHATASDSGYMVLYHLNGTVEIYKAGGTVLATGATSALSSDFKLWVEDVGGTIKAYISGPTASTIPATPIVSATDTTWRDGYVGLATFATAAQFRRLVLNPYLDNWTSSGRMDARWRHQLYLAAPVGLTYSMSPNELKVADFTADYAVRIDSSNSNDARWAAFTFHKTNQNDNVFTSGYMVALRNTGELFLYGAPPMGPLGSCTIPVPSSYQQIRVRMQGTAIQVYANGSATPCISVTNATSWPSGYVDLSASETTARFEYLEIY